MVSCLRRPPNRNATFRKTSSITLDPVRRIGEHPALLPMLKNLQLRGAGSGKIPPCSVLPGITALTACHSFSENGPLPRERERTEGTLPSVRTAGYGGVSARQQHGINHLDDAVRLHDVADRDLRHVALSVDQPQLAVILFDGERFAFHGLEFGHAAAFLDFLT